MSKNDQSNTGLSRIGQGRDEFEPHYVFIARKIREQILAGEYEEDDRLPSEAELSGLFGVSRMTARQAVTTLVDDGIVYRIRGKGAFIARTKIARDPDSLVGFHEDMLRMGLQPGSRVLSFEKRMPTPREQRTLGLRASGRVFHARRLRFLQDEPIGVQHLTVPVSVAPELTQEKLETGSFYALLRERGLPLASATQRIESVGADTVAETEEIFAQAPPTSFLRIERRSLAADGTPLELLVSWFRGDRYGYEMSLSRPPG